MENYDEILKALDNFNEHVHPIEESLPTLLEEYFKNVAKTGATHFSWKKIKLAFTHKLESVMATYEEEFPISTNPTLPNVENLTFEDMSLRLRKYLSELSGIPFTIQRVCELLVEPRRHYKKTGNFLRGIEKNINVIATVDEHGNSENWERKYTESELNSITSDSWNTNSKDPQVEDILSDIERDHAEKLSKGYKDIINKDLTPDSLIDDDIPVFEEPPPIPSAINGICNHHQAQHQSPSQSSTVALEPSSGVSTTSMDTPTSSMDTPLNTPTSTTGPDDIITTIDAACISQESPTQEEEDEELRSSMDTDSINTVDSNTDDDAHISTNDDAHINTNDDAHINTPSDSSKEDNDDEISGDDFDSEAFSSSETTSTPPTTDSIPSPEPVSEVDVTPTTTTTNTTPVVQNTPAPESVDLSMTESDTSMSILEKNIIEDLDTSNNTDRDISSTETSSYMTDTLLLDNSNCNNSTLDSSTESPLNSRIDSDLSCSLTSSIDNDDSLDLNHDVSCVGSGADGAGDGAGDSSLIRDDSIVEDSPKTPKRKRDEDEEEDENKVKSMKVSLEEE